MTTDQPRSVEMARILGIPEEYIFEAAQDFASDWTRELRRHPAAPALRPLQGLTLEAAHRQAQRGKQRGVLGNVAVGGGKTLLFYLLPQVTGDKRPLYMYPPSLRSTVEAERWKWSKHYHLSRPHLVPYSTLSQPESSALLRQLQPDLVLADECQNLRNFTAARTRRFVRYMQAHPDTRFIGLTGTLTKGSLTDYAHLAEIALRDGSPLPLDESVVKMWASVIDHNGAPDALALSCLVPLVDRYRGHIRMPAHYDDPAREERRQAYHHRLRSTPGVVLSKASSSDAAITMRGLRFPVSDALQEALDNLTDNWELPDGTEVIDTLHMDRARTELSLGFYYIWDWPGEPDEVWVEARRAYAREVRTFLKYRSREGLDSPALVEQWVGKNHDHASDIAPDLVRALDAWDIQRHKPTPPTKPVWVDYTPVIKGVEWAHKRAAEENTPVFLWFCTRAVAEALEMFGIPCLFGEDPDPSVPIVGLSTTVYHAGWNLQWARRQLVLEPDANPVTWEQLLGRTHRSGQEASEVVCDVLQHLWPLRYKMGQAVRRARTTQSTLHQQQKLLLANKIDIGPPGLM